MIAPAIGPKVGARFVTPTTNDTNNNKISLMMIVLIIIYSVPVLFVDRLVRMVTEKTAFERRNAIEKLIFIVVFAEKLFFEPYIIICVEAVAVVDPGAVLGVEHLVF